MGVTFVSGASSGIGRALALRLAARGDMIVAAARRQDLLDGLVRGIAAAGGHAQAVTCDVTDAAEVTRAIAAAAAAGPLDRIVLCAGGGRRSAAERFTAAHLGETLALNLMGVAHCVEAALPGMLARGQGHIVAVGSLAARRGLPGGAEYSAAKAALARLLEGLRVELAPRGIAVTLLEPGFVRVSAAKKRRPLEVPLDRAVGRMVAAIEARRPVCAFPLSLRLILGTLGILPAAWGDAILRRLR